MWNFLCDLQQYLCSNKSSSCYVWFTKLLSSELSLLAFLWLFPLEPIRALLALHFCNLHTSLCCHLCANIKTTHSLIFKSNNKKTCHLTFKISIWSCSTIFCTLNGFSSISCICKFSQYYTTPYLCVITISRIRIWSPLLYFIIVGLYKHLQNITLFWTLLKKCSHIISLCYLNTKCFNYNSTLIPLWCRKTHVHPHMHVKCTYLFCPWNFNSLPSQILNT